MVSLRRLENIHESTKNHPKVYKGCLSPAERTKLQEIYSDAKLRPVKPSASKFDRIRKAW